MVHESFETAENDREAKSKRVRMYRSDQGPSIAAHAGDTTLRSKGIKCGSTLERHHVHRSPINIPAVALFPRDAFGDDTLEDVLLLERGMALPGYENRGGPRSISSAPTELLAYTSASQACFRHPHITTTNQNDPHEVLITFNSCSSP